MGEDDDYNETSEYKKENTLDNKMSSSDKELGEELNTVTYETHEELWNVAVNSTEWQDITNTRDVGRFPARHIFRATPGPTPYAIENITNEAVSSFSLIINNSILEYVQHCTKIEARKVTNNSK